MSFEHINRSVEVMQALDPDRLAATRIGREVYSNDYFAQYALGSFALGNGESVHLGLQLATHPGTTTVGLLFADLMQIGQLGEYAPELLAHAPAFVGAVADKTDRSQPRAVLIEDVSEGGRHTLDPQPVSEDLLQKLHAANMYANEQGLHPITTAAAGDVEKIIFVPGPFSVKGPEYNRLSAAIAEAQTGYTVVIDGQFNLKGLNYRRRALVSQSAKNLYEVASRSKVVAAVYRHRR